MAWKHPFLEGLLQALRSKLGSIWLLWNGKKKSPSQREFPVSSVAAAPCMWNVRVPGWPCPILKLPGCLWPHRLSNSPGAEGNCPTVPFPDGVAFLLHHYHCRAASSVVQSRRSPWLSHAENQAPYPHPPLLSLHEKKRGLIKMLFKLNLGFHFPGVSLCKEQKGFPLFCFPPPIYIFQLCFFCFNTWKMVWSFFNICFFRSEHLLREGSV